MEESQPTSSGVICSCVTTLEGGQTSPSCSQCNQNSHLSNGCHSRTSGKQKFMINLEAVLF